MRVAVLGSARVPTVGFYAAALRSEFDVTVILNEKVESDRDLAIWAERTSGQEPTAIKVPVTTVRRLSESADLLRTFDIAINGGCLEKIGADALSAPRLGIINVHPGMLPGQRGCSAVEWALYYDEPIGVTAHLMDEGYDTGPVIHSEFVGPFTTRTYPAIRSEVYFRCFELGRKACWRLANGERPRAQRAGTYRNPIPPDLMTEVTRKVAAGEYRYQH